MLTILYCEKCQQKIKNFGGIAFEVFDEICQCFFEGYPLEIPTDMKETCCDIMPLIEFLEKKGFIVTTDIGKDVIAIKPLGFSDFVADTFVTHFFCLKGCDLID